MRRVFTAADNAFAFSADQNSMQDSVAGMLPADTGNDFASPGVTGVDELTWQAAAVVANATCLQIDSRDWHDRYITGEIWLIQAATGRIGQANDYGLDANTAGGAIFQRFAGYLGKGGKGAAGAAIINGVPPVVASASSWAVSATGTALGPVYLYTDPGSNVLKFYNNSGIGGGLYPLIILRAVGVTGKRP